MVKTVSAFLIPGLVGELYTTQVFYVVTVFIFSLNVYGHAKNVHFYGRKKGILVKIIKKVIRSTDI